MDPARWNEVERIFHTAADQPADRWGELIRESTSDEEIRSEVRSLLQQDDEDFLPAGELLLADQEEVVPPTLGSYVIEEEIGRGGMGIVYRARDPRLDRPVAIKLLRAPWTESGVEFTRLQREARLLARFNHPHIATIYGFEIDDDGRSFLVLELVEGENLAERLRGRAIEMSESAIIGLQIARALTAAHSKQIVHGDLKPENIIVDVAGHAKVLDFGLARETLITPADHPGPGWGTPSYLSPERWGGEEAGIGSDLFALGCILFECLSGERAFPGASSEEIRAMVLAGNPNLDALPAATPSSFRDLISRSLEIDPAARPGVGEWTSTLAGLATTSEGTGTRRRKGRGGGREELLRGSLPHSTNSFVGRQAELAELENLQHRSRLLTLTGAGGSGKTRLAIELGRSIARKHRDGTWFVDLSTVDHSHPLPEVLRSALGLPERKDESAQESVIDHLAGLQGVLILDNCEHLIQGCASLAETILIRCAQVSVVITSREVLGLVAEVSYRVSPLSLTAVPDSSRAAGETPLSEAAQLFRERARAAQPRLEAGDAAISDVEAICALLEGIPLAIELVAARTRVMSIGEIRQRLANRLDVIGRGSPSIVGRHQTLRATFQWSYELLSEEEQVLLRRLAVFVGGWDLAAAEEVGADAVGIPKEEVLLLLTALVEKSLVIHSLVNETTGRYRMLEIERQFAEEELRSSGEETLVRQRHLGHFLALADRARVGLEGIEQHSWLSRIDREHENYLSALRFATPIPSDEHPLSARGSSASADSDSGAPGSGDVNAALRICGGIYRCWILRAHVATGLRWTEQMLALAGSHADEALLADALFAAGALAAERDDHQRARGYFERSLALKQRRGEGGESELRQLGLSATRTGDHEQAREYYLRSRAEARRMGNQRAEHRAMVDLANAAITEGDFETARSTYLEILRENPTMSEWERSVLYGNCSYVGHHIGIFEESLDFAVKAASIAERAGLPGELARAKINAGRALHLAGRLAEAETYLRAAAAETRNLGVPFFQTFALNYLMSALLDGPSPSRAELETFYVESLGLAAQAGLEHAQVASLCQGARICVARNDPETALERSSRAVALLRAAPAIEGSEEEILYTHGSILRLVGREAEARSYMGRAYSVLQTKAAQMNDPQLRESFFKRVPVNVAIQQAMAETARGDPP